MLKLGYTVDIGPLWAPVDLHTAGATGLRVSLKNARSCIFVVSLAAAASGTDDLVFTLNEHTAKTAGTTQVFSNITTAWVKSATTLAGTEAWVKTTQAVGSTFTLPGATYATKQVELAIQVNAPDLDATFNYVSLSVAATAVVARLGSGLTLLTDLQKRFDPASMPATLV